MNNKISLNQKLDLLLISLESLDTFQTNNLIKVQKNICKDDYNIQKINSDLIDLVRHAISMQKYKKITYCYFTNFIIYIYIINKKINYYLLYQKANFILTHYIKYSKSSSLKQYIRKFNYLYFGQNQYYTNYKYIDYKYKRTITKIAIKNLYLIAKLINGQGIYVLIKYLHD